MPRSSSRPRRDGLLLGRVAGQRQEDVVERRPSQARCRRCGCPPRRGRGRPGRGRPRRRWPGAVTRRVCSSSGDVARAVARQDLASRAAIAARSWTTTSIRSPPTCDLSSSAVPRAMILPWSTTAIVSASSSASSRYCVVSSSVVPSRTRPRMTSHIPSRLRGSRPVVGSSRNSSRGRPMSALAEVEPAAHAAGVRLDDAIGGVDEVELLEQLVRPARGLGRATAGRAARTATGSRARSGSRRPRRTGRTGR